MLSEREAYIALNLIREVGPVTVRLLSETLGSASAIFEADARQLLAVRGTGTEIVKKIIAARKKVNAAQEIERAAELGAELLTPADDAYPEPLRQIYDPPLALYIKGTLSARDRHAMAIVGSRHTTAYGRECAASFASSLARAGFTIVSGLARGIDTSAHQGALRAGGRTLAVLGGGLHDIYPPENRALADEIAASGAILTEFQLGREPDKTTFPIRNRIVSGLSQGVLVVEAGLSSGAMITANVAAEQGKSVFAIPGRIDSPTSQGTHHLIKNGVRLVESAEEVMEDLGSLFTAVSRSAARAPEGSGHSSPISIPLSEAEQVVMQRLMEDDRLDIDTLVRQCGLPAATVSATLLMLEMKKLVRSLPGRFVEVISRNQHTI
jgi:DNA processing protein